MGFAGPQPIGWQDIDAFMRRAGLTFAPWEVDLIERLDDIYLRPASAPALPDGQAVTVAASIGDSAGVRAVLGSVGNRRYVKRKGG